MILLDTHTLIWALDDVPRLGARSVALIAGAQKRYVSAVTHIELSIKAARHKLTIPEKFRERLGAAGYDPLPLTAEHAGGLGEFPELVGHDPFYRMLVAQAFIEGLSLLTADRRLLALDRSWIVDAST